MDLTKVTRDWNHADTFLDNKYSDTKKYVDNLINPEFVYDETAVSCKTVPENVKDFAVVEKIYGKTIKDGETLKSAPIESVVSVGKNIWDEKWEKGGYNATTGEPGSSTAIRGITYIPIKPNTTYSSNKYLRFVFYDENKTFISSATGAASTTISTSPSNAKYLRINTRTDYNNGTSIYNNDIIVSESDEPLSYVPYFETTISVPQSIKNLPDYGLALDESKHNYIDFESGKYYHNVFMIDIGNETIRQNSTRPNIKIISKYGTYNDALIKVISNAGLSNTLHNQTQGISAMTEGDFRVSDYIYIYDEGDATTTAERFVGTKIILALATPEVIDISDIIRPIKCETGGTITLKNEHNLDVANTIIYEREVSEHD